MDYQLSKMNIAITNGDSIRAPKKENGSCHRYGSTEIQGILLIIKSLELNKKRELIIKSSKQTLKEGKNVSPMKEY